MLHRELCVTFEAEAPPQALGCVCVRADNGKASPRCSSPTPPTAMFSLFRTFSRPSRMLPSLRQAVCTIRHPLRSRFQSSRSSTPTENLNVSHARFLAEGSRSSKWVDGQPVPGNDGLDSPAEDYDSLSDGRGEYQLEKGSVISSCVYFLWPSISRIFS
jgi:hypothetical protein